MANCWVLLVTKITLKFERDKYRISFKNLQKKGCFTDVWVDVKVKLKWF